MLCTHSIAGMHQFLIAYWLEAVISCHEGIYIADGIPPEQIRDTKKAINMEALLPLVVWWNTTSAVIFWLERLILEQYGL